MSDRDVPVRLVGWPPLPSATSIYAEQRLMVQHDERPRKRLRQVRLWGRDVWFDDDSGRVWCHCCMELLEVDVLGRKDNGHPVGIIWPRAGGLLLLPLDDAEDGQRASMWENEPH